MTAERPKIMGMIICQPPFSIPAIMNIANKKRYGTKNTSKAPFHASRNRPARADIIVIITAITAKCSQPYPLKASAKILNAETNPKRHATILATVETMLTPKIKNASSRLAFSDTTSEAKRF